LHENEISWGKKENKEQKGGGGTDRKNARKEAASGSENHFMRDLERGGVAGYSTESKPGGLRTRVKILLVTPLEIEREVEANQ